MKRVRLSVVAWLLSVSSLLFLSGCDLFPYSHPISPARDLTGTWRNKLPGKGIEFIMGGNCPEGTILEAWGDVELELSQKGNDLTGTARIYNLSFTALRPGEQPRWACDHYLAPWRGRLPIGGRVTGSRVGFTSQHGGGTCAWEGSFTTDLMSGDVSSISLSIPGGSCFEIQGEFSVMRE